MPDLRVECDAAKAARNEAEHGVSFETATLAFDEPFALEWLDDRDDYGEEHFVGMVDSRLL